MAEQRARGDVAGEERDPDEQDLRGNQKAAGMCGAWRERGDREHGGWRA